MLRHLGEFDVPPEGKDVLCWVDGQMTIGRMSEGEWSTDLGKWGRAVEYWCELPPSPVPSVGAVQP